MSLKSVIPVQFISDRAHLAFHKGDQRRLRNPQQCFCLYCLWPLQLQR